MSINKTLTLKWGENSYNVKVTMGLIDRVDEDLNAIKMLNRAAQGDIRFTQVAKLVSILLDSVGVKASQEDVWTAMFSNEQTDPQAAASFAVEVLSAMFPETKKKVPAKPRAPRSKATRGKTSTK